MAEPDAAVPLLVLASACWDSPARVNCHEIAQRFARRGHRVLFVESTGLRSPALRASAHDRRRLLRRSWSWLRGAREVEPGLHVVSPLALPFTRSQRLRRLSLGWIAGSVKRAVARLGLERPVIWAYLPTHLEAVRRIDARLTIYHCVDHYARNPGVDPVWIEALEARMLRAVDVVFASSRTLHERLGRSRGDVELLENVADVELFSGGLGGPVDEPEELRSFARPRAVYVGNLARYRTDVGFLRTAAERLPRTSFVLIGVIGLGDVERSDRAFADLLALPNVVWLGARPHGSLAAYLSYCDVALIPFLDNDHTRASLPLKLWEYLAAGLPVVATDLPNLRGLGLGDALTLVRDADAFAAAIAEASRGAGTGGIASRRERSRLALGHGWSERIESIAAILDRRICEKQRAPHLPAAAGQGSDPRVGLGTASAMRAELVDQESAPPNEAS